jgi:hypothetical protein
MGCELLASGSYSWTFGLRGKILPPVPNNIPFIASEVIQHILNETEIKAFSYQQLVEQAKHALNIATLPVPAETPSRPPTSK